MAAKRPSKRRKHHREMEFELKLIPIISLLCVLIPILLQGAVFVRTAAQDVNLPSTDAVRYVGAAEERPPAETLTLAVTESGFTLVSGQQTLARLPRSGAAGFDFAGLENAVKAAKNRYPERDAIVLLVSDRVVYDDVIHAMDRCRPSFPKISLADRIEGS